MVHLSICLSVCLLLVLLSRTSRALRSGFRDDFSRVEAALVGAHGGVEAVQPAVAVEVLGAPAHVGLPRKVALVKGQKCGGDEDAGRRKSNTELPLNYTRAM